MAAAALCPPFRPVPEGSGSHTLRSDAADLPDVTLALRQERRMFSRSWPLALDSGLEGDGPAEPLALRFRRRPLRRGAGFEATSPAGAPWAAAFEDAGVLRGAARMTSVQDLSISWEPQDRRWTLRMLTLAGAMIGTAPGSFIAVPLEADDVAGILEVLRAFRRGVPTRG